MLRKITQLIITVVPILIMRHFLKTGIENNLYRSLVLLIYTLIIIYIARNWD